MRIWRTAAFTAAQTAQKIQSNSVLHSDSFTAAQAAQKNDDANI